MTPQFEHQLSVAIKRSRFHLRDVQQTLTSKTIFCYKRRLADFLPSPFLIVYFEISGSNLKDNLSTRTGTVSLAKHTRLHCTRNRLLYVNHSKEVCHSICGKCRVLEINCSWYLLNYMCVISVLGTGIY